jgi:CHASE2 domain-containing sensor protein
LVSTEPRGGRLGTRQGVVISIACFALLAVLEWVGVFSDVDLKLLDVKFRLRGERMASDAVVLVEVDDATIGAYDQWPLPRETYGLLLAVLTEAGARAVGVDLLLAGRDAKAPQSDLLLATVTAGAPNVCHAIAFDPGELGLAAGDHMPKRARELLRRHRLEEGPKVRAALAGSALLPFTELLEAASAVGHILVAADSDGGIRRVPLVVRYGRDLYPALGLRLAALARGHGALQRVDAARGGFNITCPDGHILFVPVDDEGATSIDFAGNCEAFERCHSMIDVLRWYQEGDRDRLTEAFADRIVLIGNTAVGEAATDVGRTPFAVTTPLVYVHANLVDAVLGERFLRSPPRSVYLLALACLSILLGYLFASLPFKTAVATMGGAAVIIACVEYGLFALFRINVPSMVPLLLPVLVYVTIETYRSVFMERRARERDKELAIARQVQQDLFPKSLPSADGWEFAGVCHPAREVGGDYYDLLQVDDDHIAFALGDVSGKGLGPSILMSSVHAMVRSHLRRPGASPGALVAELNEHLNASSSPGMFITFFLGVLNVRTGELRYVNGGHNPGVLVDTEGSAPTLLETGGMVVGVMPGAAFEEGEVLLEPGSTLSIFSDGVTEALNEREDMFGDERLLTVLTSAAGQSAEATLARVVRAVEDFRGRREPADDLSVVVIHRSGAANKEVPRGDPA